MKKISIVFVAVVSLSAFGCDKRADCGKAVDNGTEVQKADLPTGIDDKMRGKMKDLAMSHCKDDKWADDVLQCMSEAKAGTDFKTCQSKLTPEQKASMQTAMKDLMAREGMAPAGGDGKRADCGKAVDNGTEVQKADLPPGIDDKMRGKMKDLAMSHCKDDKWADDVLQCMSEAKAGTDFKTCQSKLTPEQKASMQTAMKDLMAREGIAHAGGDSSAPPAGSGAGSAAAKAAAHP